MRPREVLRLEMAFQLQQNVVDLYKRYVNVEKNVTFVDVFRSYEALGDLEKRTEPWLNQSPISRGTLIKTTSLVLVSFYSSRIYF